MRDEPRFVNLRQVEGLDSGTAKDLANALDDPYNVIKERKSGDFFIAWDNALAEPVEELREDIAGQFDADPDDVEVTGSEEVSE